MSFTPTPPTLSRVTWTPMRERRGITFFRSPSAAELGTLENWEPRASRLFMPLYALRHRAELGKQFAAQVLGNSKRNGTHIFPPKEHLV